VAPTIHRFDDGHEKQTREHSDPNRERFLEDKSHATQQLTARTTEPAPDLTLLWRAVATGSPPVTAANVIELHP